jgi:hypothetical protein
MQNAWGIALIAFVISGLCLLLLYWIGEEAVSHAFKVFLADLMNRPNDRSFLLFAT